MANNDNKFNQPGFAIAFGIAIGLLVYVATESLVAGAALGIAMYLAYHQYLKNRRS